jgi:uncharacterized protein YgiM (DUF1202 family)
MRKKTLSIILDAFIVLLVLTIILLIVMIGKRGAAPIQQAQAEEGDSLAPVVTSENGTVAVTTEAPEPTEAVVAEEKILYATPDARDTVNVRSGAGTNFDKLGSASTGQEFEVISVLAVGWTKLNYNGQEGYIHNDYLDYYYKVQDENGNETKEEVELSAIPKVEE